MIDDIWNELNEGEIHVRDSLQFELKSEFSINPLLKQNTYKQEVFIFIPSSLQVNSQTYSKKQFYLDQTNLIRYRTPFMTLEEVYDPNFSFSPLNRLQNLLIQLQPNSPSTSAASDELKLLAAIFRASMRSQVYDCVKKITHPTSENFTALSNSIESLCSKITKICFRFRLLQQQAKTTVKNNQLNRYFKYIDEAMSMTIEKFLIILLKHLRNLSEEKLQSAEKSVYQLILKEKTHRKKNHLSPKTLKGRSFSNEAILYRQGLLNRFILEALMLKSHRISIEEKHSDILGAMAAGVAMLIYMVLFIWKSSTFVINSFPFVVLGVFLYILKDRIKEGLKKFYFNQAYRWFPDFSTEITSPKGYAVGKLTESFAFIDQQQLPEGFLTIRNHDFHEELQALHRHETIIQYKRKVILNSSPGIAEVRRRELTTIFRLNIHHMLQKASEAFQTSYSLDSYTREINEKLLPKIYHINIIIRDTYLQGDGKPKSKIQTYRVVVDKSGIKRVEHINHKKSK